VTSVGTETLARLEVIVNGSAGTPRDKYRPLTIGPVDCGVLAAVRGDKRGAGIVSQVDGLAAGHRIDTGEAPSAEQESAH